jgi:ribosomal protein L22
MTPEEEKPKRRRLRRKGTEEEASEAGTPTEAGAEEATAEVEPADGGEAAVEDAPKPARPRRKRAAAAKPVAEAEAEAEAESVNEPEAEAAAAPEAAAEAEAAAEEPEAEAAADEPEAEAPAEAPEADAPKPARTRRRGRRGAEEPPAAPRPARRAPKRDPNLPPPLVRAYARNVHSSPRKARLVCDHIRGKSVEEARAILAMTTRAVARDWSKLLESAVANAEHNHELVGEDLYVKVVKADDGPTLKRYRPRAMGRATKIRKRTTHLTILLTPKE